MFFDRAADTVTVDGELADVPEFAGLGRLGDGDCVEIGARGARPVRDDAGGQGLRRAARPSRPALPHRPHRRGRDDPVQTSEGGILSRAGVLEAGAKLAMMTRGLSPRRLTNAQVSALITKCDLDW